MRRVVSATVIAGVALFSLRVAAQAALPTVDQVLEKHIAAAGGRAAMEKQTSRVGKGTFEIPDMGMSGSAVVTEKAPNMSLAVIEIPGMGTIREGTDGKTAWDDTPGTGVREKSGAELAEALRGAAFNPELKLKSLYKTVEVTGREKVGAADTVVLQLTSAEGSVTKMYFDASSGLMIRQQMNRETQAGPMAVDIFLEDYRAVDGVKIPHIVRQVTAQYSLVIKIAEIRHNVAIDDAIFRKPGI